MRRPHCCPICNDFSVETVLQEYAVTAKVKEEDWAVNALTAFKCRNGHIFSCAEVTWCLSRFRLSGPAAKDSGPENALLGGPPRILRVLDLPNRL